MPDYIVSGEQLTAIANAIREKTGNTGSLTFPGGFTEGISGIETVRSIDALIDGSMTRLTVTQVALDITRLLSIRVFYLLIFRKQHLLVNLRLPVLINFKALMRRTHPLLAPAHFLGAIN